MSRIIKQLLLSVIIIIISFCSAGFAQCDIGKNGYIFNHPLFSSIRWRSPDNIEVNLPQTICSNTPSKVIMSGKTEQIYATFVSESGVVSISTITYEKAADCFCCLPTLSFSEPLESGITLDSNSAIDAFRKGDSLLLAFSELPLKIKLFTLNSKGEMVHKDSSTLRSANSNQVIKTVSFDATKNGIWVGGSGGLIRYISFNNNELGGETQCDITSNDTIVVVSNDFAASSQGKIYSGNNNIFTLNTTLSLRVNHGRSTWLAGDGTIAYKMNSQWKIETGVPEIANAHLIYCDSGPVLEWIDQKWQTGNKTLLDRPTTIKKISPEFLNQHINKTPYEMKQNESLSFTVYLSDPDFNIKLPAITLSNQFSRSLYDGLSYKLSGMTQDVSCNIGSAVLNSDSMKITISPNKISWQSDFTVGALDFTCGNCTRVNRHLLFEQNYGNYKSLKISSGQTSLEILLFENIHVHAIKNINEQPFQFSFREKIVQITTGNHRQSGGTVKVYSLTGKVLTTMVFGKNLNSLSVPLQQAAQSVLVKILFYDGYQFQQIVPCLR